MAHPLSHWELVINDPARSKQFYSRVFGWRFDDSSEALRVVVGAGGTVLVPRTEIPPGWFAMFLDVDRIPIGIVQTTKAGAR